MQKYCKSKRENEVDEYNNMSVRENIIITIFGTANMPNVGRYLHISDIHFIPTSIYIILKAISILTFRIKVQRSHERAQMIKARRCKQLIAQI